MAKKYWNYMLARKIAKKYSSKREFRLKEAKCYRFCVNKGYLEQITAHMVDLREEKKWTFEAVAEISKKYPTRGALKRNNVNAYTAALKYCYLDDLYETDCSQAT